MKIRPPAGVGEHTPSCSLCCPVPLDSSDRVFCGPGFIGVGGYAHWRYHPCHRSRCTLQAADAVAGFLP